MKDRPWLYPQYRYRGIQPCGTEFYTNTMPTKLESMWELDRHTTIITNNTEPQLNWLRIQQATPEQLSQFFESQIKAKVVTQHQKTSITIDCIVTANLEVFIRSHQNAFPDINITYGSYHRCQGLDIEVNDPVLEAMQWVLRGEYRVRQVNLITHGILAVTEGWILKETHLFKVEQYKLRTLDKGVPVEKGLIWD